MKKILTLLLILIVQQTIGQNYKMFNASSKKLFSDSRNTFSIAFDSTIASGNDSVYYNFFTIQNVDTPADSCRFWGPNSCKKQDKPVGFGKKINYVNNKLYRFFPVSGDTLSCNLSITRGDTTLIYKDTVQKFFIIYEKADTLTTLNYADSARFYKILHTDTAGNTISSPLNGKEIIIGKNLGLIQFFYVDSFPQVLRPLYLIGNESPNCGMFELTNEMIFDYRPGDVIQYMRYERYNPPRQSDFCYYITYTFIDRTTTADMLKYKVVHIVYDTIKKQTTIDTINLTYSRHAVIAKIPFEYFDGTYRKLYFAPYCGVKTWIYSIAPDPTIGYCSIENCWGPTDTNGPPARSQYYYIAGIGEDWEIARDPVDPKMFSGYWRGLRIVHFIKNGIACGSEVLGVNENKATHTLQIAPNPFSEQTIIKADYIFHNASLTVYNLYGEAVKKVDNLSGQTIVLHRNNLPSGLYFIRLMQNDKLVTTEKIVITDK